MSCTKTRAVSRANPPATSPVTQKLSPEAPQADAEQPIDAVDASDQADELAKVKDQLLRTVAEMENVRRRAQRDVENAHKFAVEKLLGELLPVLDSLEKAEEVAKEQTTPPAWQKASACRSSCLSAF